MKSADSIKPPGKSLRQAATVLLLRDGFDGVEVLMMHRHAEMHFGDAWVFPGGTIDDVDCAYISASAEEDYSRCVARLATGNSPATSREFALGLHVAACREVFEETGLLLVTDGKEKVARIRAQRAEIASRAGAFADIIAREQLQLNLDRLIYWSHWITPASSPKRFDTRFFAALAPADQEVLADASESSEFLWIAPAKLIAERTTMKAVILPPTLLTLMDLANCAAQHRTAAEMLMAEAGRKALAIMPKLRREGSETVTIYPWDSEYDSMPDEGISTRELPPHLQALPSRLILRRHN
jgi:8-oxo-dGTP pyrophosphatase MutT (NUDIX family)